MAKKKKTQKKTKPPVKHKPKVKKKQLKKKFFPVESKLTSQKISLYASTPEDLENKTIKIDLTKSLRGRAFELKLKVVKEKDKLITEPLSLQLFQTYVKRITRKGTDYVEDSFEVNCRDHKLRIKPLLVTRKRVSRSVLSALREEAKKHITAYVKIRTAKEVFTEITSNKLQKPMSIKLKKIYPLSLSEIRGIQVLEKVETKDKESKKEKEEKTEPKE